MSTATLRSVGGSVVMAIPKHILEMAQLRAGTQVEIDIQDGRIVIIPKKPRYTLAELMAQCDLSQGMDEEEREWLETPPVGEEL